MGIAPLFHGLPDLGLDNDEFAHQIDQGVELVRRHPDTTRGLLAATVRSLRPDSGDPSRGEGDAEGGVTGVGRSGGAANVVEGP